MGKQFSRLVTEQLKEYYKKSLEEYKEQRAVIMRLLEEKEQYLVKLRDELTKSFKSKYSESPILEAEIEKVSKEISGFRREQAIKSKELQIGKIDVCRIQSEIFEKRLDLVEEKLNSRGIIIDMVDGNVRFKTKE
ncbi:MAG: hypothetical protein HQ575_03800 [Candidatus Omnitrophica bacterium]|nr:hypothetical protein [Candidatus Omnitrophota bacterium]